jgi:hypothetical protein
MVARRANPSHAVDDYLDVFSLGLCHQALKPCLPAKHLAWHIAIGDSEGRGVFFAKHGVFLIVITFVRVASDRTVVSLEDTCKVKGRDPRLFVVRQSMFNVFESATTRKRLR